MGKKIEAVIFDWAGTTVDYGCFAPVQAFTEVFKEAGIEPTMEEVREPMGMLKWDHIRTMLRMPRIEAAWTEKYGKKPEDTDADQLFSKFEPSLLKILNQFSDPKPHVVETVNELRAKGIKLGSTTGYTDTMMEIVVPEAKRQGYAPDCWYSPDSTGGMGRPYPYMIFKNLETLKISSVDRAIKVGDTVSDIKEGKNAGMFTVGILEGSSVMGLTQKEYEGLSEQERVDQLAKAERKYKEAGADRYLLRHETANEDHYRHLHPEQMSLANRKQCLRNLKELGYQTGAGFMVGAPGQTLECLAEDLIFLKELNPEMVGIGPFIPHHDTKFADEPAGSVELTLFLLSVLRIILPKCLLPATTALGTADPKGREKGLLAGANVVMPNLSPVKDRKKYELYDNKICTGDEAAECRVCLKNRVKSVGFELVEDRGDVAL